MQHADYGFRTGRGLDYAKRILVKRAKTFYPAVVPKTAEPLILAVLTRFMPDDMAALDHWRRRQPDLPSHSEAFQRMAWLVRNRPPETG
jgi:hypothetical protein